MNGMRPLCALAAFLLFSAGLSAQVSLDLSAAARTSVGSTSYQLTQYSGNTGIVSQLEFPLDVYHAGGAATLSTPDVQVRAHFSAALTDPRKLMKDHDWYDLVNGPALKWSYTESPVEHIGYLGAFGGEYRLFSSGPHEIWATAGYRYEYVHQRIIGYDGWQFDFETYQGAEIAEHGTLAGVYRIHLHTPLIGIRYRLTPVEQLSMSAGVAYALMVESDYDDHVLRNKESSSRGVGNGVRATATIEAAPFDIPGARPFLRISGEAFLGFVSTTSTQRWYGDDPATPNEDDTGSVVADIPHTVYTIQASASVAAGVRVPLGSDGGGR